MTWSWRRVCFRAYVCMYPLNRSRPHTPPTKRLFLGSCLLPDLACGLLQAVVALLVCPARTETRADDGGPRPALEQEDREDDAEAEAEGGLDQEVGEAAVPLCCSPAR